MPTVEAHSGRRARGGGMEKAGWLAGGEEPDHISGGLEMEPSTTAGSGAWGSWPRCWDPARGDPGRDAGIRRVGRASCGR